MKDTYTRDPEGRNELWKRLETCITLCYAIDTVKDALIDEIASAISMPPEDVDRSKAVSFYGVDSSIANEIRNRAVHSVKGSMVRHTYHRDGIHK